MPRIRKYPQDSDNSENSEKKQEKLSIKKTEDKSQELSQQKSVKRPFNSDRSATVENLLDVFGSELFEKLRTNKDINFAFDTEDINSDKEWVQKVLDTFVSDEEIKIIDDSLNELLSNSKQVIQKLEVELDKKSEELDSLRNELSKAEEDADKLFSENKSLKEEVNQKISFSKVLQALFAAPEYAGFQKLLTEAVSNYGDPNTGDFILSFIEGWLPVTKAYSAITNQADEENNVEIMDKALREMLDGIRDKSIPQRRALLDAVARFVSSKFNEFEFVSPEETSQIDINLHNAQGTGGSKIKQGISFAVVRKNNRRTFKYADIEIQ